MRNPLCYQCISVFEGNMHNVRLLSKLMLSSRLQSMPMLKVLKKCPRIVIPNRNPIPSSIYIYIYNHSISTKTKCSTLPRQLLHSCKIIRYSHHVFESSEKKKIKLSLNIEPKYTDEELCNMCVISFNYYTERWLHPFLLKPAEVHLYFGSLCAHMVPHYVTIHHGKYMFSNVPHYSTRPHNSDLT